MKVLVTGRNGQLARSIVERSVEYPYLEMIYTGQDVLDFENVETIRPFVIKTTPDIIINVAAWTAVDDAEDEPERAHTVNVLAAEALAKGAFEVGAKFIHISTDYVYGGNKSDPYFETDVVDPKNVYGRTKLEGEQRILSVCPTAIILRTAWVYSQYGKNFVKSMLSLAENNDRLKIVDDQIGCPTSAPDLAKAIFSIINVWRKNESRGLGRVYNCAGSGEVSWAKFASHIFNESQKLDGPFAEVTAISTAEYPTKAIRPLNSRLDCTRLNETFDINMPPWKESVSKTVSVLLSSNTIKARRV